MNDHKRPEDRITDAVIACLEKGTTPWTKPWANLTSPYSKVAMPRRVTGEAYQGINVVMLWLKASLEGYSGQTWMTYRQAAELGGQVRKAEQSTLVTYYGQAKSNKDTGPDGEASSYRFLKGYPVFNVDQIEGLDAKFYPVAAVTEPTVFEVQDKIAQIERFIASMGADIQWTGDRAYYALSPDHIRLPEWRLFKDAEQAYATALHELVHWTAHGSRLNRDLTGRFGSATYAFEELVADMGAAFLGQRLGLRPDHIGDHASYIASWLKALQDDSRMVLKAASLAQAATDFLWTKSGLGQLDLEEAA